jgi:tetratricopeptide (TPR) repeat protein
MKHSVLLSLLFIFSTQMIFAQGERATGSGRGGSFIFQQETPRTFNLMHTPGEFEHKEPTNAIISRMGNFYGLNPATSFRAEIRYTEIASIKKTEGQLALEVKIKQTGVSMQRIQPIYDLNPFLLPDRMNFRVQLADGAGNVLFEQPFSEVVITPFTSGDQPVAVVNLQIPDEYSQEGLTLRIREVIIPRAQLLFYHSPQQKEKLFARLDVIAEYEQNAIRLEEVCKKVQAINPGDLEKLQTQLEALEGYKLVADEIGGKGYARSLGLDKNDPKGIIQKQQTFASLYQEKKQALQHALRTLDDSYYNKGMEFLGKKDYASATNWFNKALGMNPKHVGANYQLAWIDFQQGRHEQARERAERVLSTMNPDARMKSLLNQLLEDIRQKESAGVVAGYREILNRAEKELLRGNIEQALRELDMAARYQSDYSQFIPDNREVRNVFDKIAVALTADAERDVKAGRFPQAIQKYHDVMGLLDRFVPELLQGSGLSGRINQIHEMVVQRLAQSAQGAITRGDFGQAENFIDQIMDYYYQTPLLPQGNILMPVLMTYQGALLFQGQQKMNEKSYAQAFELLNRCLNAGEKYGLEQPPGIFRMLDDARNGVFTSLLFSGQQAMNTKDYTAAEFYLKEAMHFLQNKMSPSSRVALDAYKQNLMGAYLDEGRKYMNFRDFNKAIEYFDLAQAAQYNYGIPTQVIIPELVSEAREGIAIGIINGARSNLEKQRFNQAMNGLRDAFQYMDDHNLRGNAMGQFVLVADDYYRDALQQIDQLNRAKSYGRALEFVADARYICDSYPIRCVRGDVDQRERDSRQGIYLGMVGEADKALGRGDLGGARTKISEAQKYQQDWSHLLPVAAEASQVLARIRQKDYQNQVAAGKAMLDRKDYRQALPLLNEAWMLEQDGGFKADPRLAEYRKTAAYHTIMSEADQLEQMLGSANYMTTKDKLLQIMTMRTKYNLQDNKEITSRLNNLQNRMVSAACRQQQELYDQHMDQAYAFAKDKRFIEAGDAIGKAIEAAARLPECAVDDTSAVKYLVQLTPAIQYQEKLAESNRLLQNYKNPEAMHAYLEAEALYNKGSVKVYGIDHEPFASYVLKQNLNFILSAAYYYKEQGKIMESLRMITHLADKGYPPAQTRLLQEQIGYQLGREERLKYPGSKWKVAVLQHTSGRKFFSYFRKSYKKGWNSIKV